MSKVSPAECRKSFAPVFLRFKLRKGCSCNPSRHPWHISEETRCSRLLAWSEAEATLRRICKNIVFTFLCYNDAGSYFEGGGPMHCSVILLASWRSILSYVFAMRIHYTVSLGYLASKQCSPPPYCPECRKPKCWKVSNGGAALRYCAISTAVRMHIWPG
jgi:hypothetical protein